MKAALVYAQAGWAVLPVEPNGKRPILKDWTNAASSDPAQVAQWVERYPTANVGIATGPKSGVFALDVDPRSGGVEALENLVRTNGFLPKTVQARTGSGGAHYLFKLPDFTVSNSAGKLGSGLDIRGEGGQIVVAPSRTPAGTYQWVNAPWDTEIAEAPEWLLSLLRDKPKLSKKRVFPPATPDVLGEAAAALLEHGPAIEGEGGDEHTFKAAAILMNDFALTEDEALPLLEEWNETCDPPWEEEDLLTKLQMGGRERAKAPEYGCKRRPDFLAELLERLARWRREGGHDRAIPAMLSDARAIVSESNDPGFRALAERELVQATGLKANGIALPKIRLHTRPIPPQAIEVTPELHTVANAATKTLVEDVFQRAGVLCEVIKDETTFISELETPRIQDLMSEKGKYFRTDEKGRTPQAPPLPVASILRARRAHVGIRPLVGVTESPIFLANGNVLQAEGYDPDSKLWLQPSVKVEVKRDASLDDARKAVGQFRDLLSDFTFLSDADFSTWLAGLLSPLVKAATKNAPAPIFCISASNAGAGKSLLSNLIARIITGRDAENSPYNPKDPAEWGKRLTAFVKMGSPIRVLDNCNGAFGDEGLDRLITSPTWSDRILGVTDAPPLANVTTWFATGNNIEPIGDTVRRVAVCRLRVDVERPQERSGFKYDKIAEYALEHRAELLCNALTILRAFHTATRPTQKLKTWGSFEAWSELVRNALVWAGCADPYLTQERAVRELGESETVAHDFWLSVLSAAPETSADLAAKANVAKASDVLGLRHEVTAFTLRTLVQRFVDKPRRGQRISREVNDSQQVTYRITSVSQSPTA